MHQLRVFSLFLRDLLELEGILESVLASMFDDALGPLASVDVKSVLTLLWSGFARGRGCTSALNTALLDRIPPAITHVHNVK